MIESRLGLELLLIFLLILANGVFSMSEIAVVSSRKSRLQQRAQDGDSGARRALALAENPTPFLSTVQIGITLVGVFTGAYGGASIAGQLAVRLRENPALVQYSEEIALAAVVVTLTFLSLVLGELVPKSIALTNPERIAARIAGPMTLLSRVASPLVTLLCMTTDGIVRLFGIRKSDEPPVTEQEVSALVQAGADAGVFEDEEQDLVERVFSLGDRRASSLMTPRHRIAWLDVADSPEQHRKEMVQNRFSHYLVCEQEVDKLLGMVRVKDLLAALLEGAPLDLRAALRKPLIVPENVAAFRLLELFRESRVHLAVVVDEYGGVEGLVTLNDVLDEIAGHLAADREHDMTKREDGSWLIDGSLPMDDFWQGMGLEERRGEKREEYHTLAGFVVTELGRIPKTGTVLEVYGLRLEVVDMDGHRVDKLLVSRLTPQAHLEQE